MVTENWLPVPYYEGFYEVSDQGRVRSLSRTDMLGRAMTGRVLSARPNGRWGHLSVQLSRDAVKRSRLVHHLVLEAFVGPRPEGLEACHGNGDAGDNRLSNLRWDTHQANVADTLRHGRHTQTNQTHCVRGHPLGSPNIHPSVAAVGGRRCRACTVAAAAVREGYAINQKVYADAWLTKIWPDWKKAKRKLSA